MASGTSPLSYQWRKNVGAIAGATAAEYLIGVATTNDAAGYDVVVTNMAGATTSVVATLTVLVPPRFTVDPTNATVVAGATVEFAAEALGVPSPGLQWFFADAALAGPNLAELILTNVQPTNAGSYYAVASSAAGVATSAVATLTVVLPPVITNEPVSLTVTNGAAVDLTVGVDGLLLSYQWRKDGQPISGANTADYHLAAATTNDTGGYDVVVTNIAGAVTSLVATLIVEVTPVILEPPQNLVVEEGEAALFSVAAWGLPTPTLQWRHDGELIEGATNASLTISSAQLADAGEYDAVAANAAGTVTSATAALTVTLRPLVISSALSNGWMQLWWTPGVAGYRLQGQTNLAGGGIGNEWSDVNGVTNNTWSAPLPSGDTSIFFRLVRP